MQYNLEGFTTVKASTSVLNGGGTGKEFPINLLSNGQDNWNKWITTSSSEAVIQFIFNSPIEITSFGLKSANDEKVRDPAEACLFVFDEGRG